VEASAFCSDPGRLARSERAVLEQVAAQWAVVFELVQEFGLTAEAAESPLPRLQRGGLPP